MLSSIRNTTDSFFVKILLLLLVASFALWGVGDMVGQREAVKVATVGDMAVTGEEYYEALARLRINLGEYFTPEVAQSLRLYEMTMAGLISDKLVESESEALGFIIGDVLTKRIMASDERFRDKDGFDRDRFERYVRQLQMTEQEFVDHLRTEAHEYIIAQTIAPQKLFDNTLVNMLYTVQEEQRRALAFVVNTLPEDARLQPQDGELRDYYEANKTRYRAPEFRVLEYVMVDREAVSSVINVLEKDLSDAYFERQKELLTPEKRHVIQLLYDDKALAEQAYGMLRSGKSITQVIEVVAPTNETSMDLGRVTKTQLPESSDTVFMLEKGGYTAPIQTAFGWHVFHVKDIEPAFTPSFESMKEELREELLRERSNETMVRMVEKLEDSIAAGFNLEEAANALGIALQRTNSIDEYGRGADNTMALDPTQYGTFLEVGFIMPKGELSEVRRLENGAYFVLMPTEITEERQRVFEEVQGMVASDWQEQQTDQLKRQYVENFVKGLAEDIFVSEEDIIARLNESGIDVVAPIIVKRDQVVEAGQHALLAQQHITPAFIEGVFDAKEPKSILVPVEHPEEGFLAGIYLETLPFPQERLEQSHSEISRRLEKQFQQEINQQFLAALSKRYPVEQDSLAVDRIIRQFQ